MMRVHDACAWCVCMVRVHGAWCTCGVCAVHVVCVMCSCDARVWCIWAHVHACVCMYMHACACVRECVCEPAINLCPRHLSCEVHHHNIDKTN